MPRLQAGTTTHTKHSVRCASDHLAIYTPLLVTMIICGTISVIMVPTEGPKIFSSSRTRARSNFKFNPVLPYNELSVDQ